MLKKPNLFEYATSELSQDAFICWLLSWAKKEYVNVDKSLHETGKYFLLKLIQQKLENFLDYHKIEIKPQYEKIDILVIIDDEYALIIEDKVHSKNHSDQLNRYYKIVKDKGFKEENIIPIYFKTGFQANSNIESYKPFWINNFLEVLEKGNEFGIKNDIFESFYLYLKNLDLSVKQFEDKPVIKWENADWIGFYMNIYKKIEGYRHWEYVSNPTGGFMGFWWYFKNKENLDFTAYLQIEPVKKDLPKFCFKVKVHDKEKVWDIRKKWLNLLIETSKTLNLKVEKVKRFGSGKHQTIAILSDDFILQNDKYKIDYDYLFEVIEKAQKIIDKSIKSY